MWWSKPKCQHQWKVVDKHVEPAPLNAKTGSIEGPAGIIEGMTRGTYICIMACEKCGAIDKTVEKV